MNLRKLTVTALLTAAGLTAFVADAQAFGRKKKNKGGDCGGCETAAVVTAPACGGCGGGYAMAGGAHGGYAMADGSMGGVMVASGTTVVPEAMPVAGVVSGGYVVPAAGYAGDRGYVMPANGFVGGNYVTPASGLSYGQPANYGNAYYAQPNNYGNSSYGRSGYTNSGYGTGRSGAYSGGQSGGFLGTVGNLPGFRMMGGRGR